MLSKEFINKKEGKLIGEHFKIILELMVYIQNDKLMLIMPIIIYIRGPEGTII